MTMPIAVPYGLRDIKIVPYPSLAATAFGVAMIDLPHAQTFTFTEAEDYEDLRGDDRLITSHGKGPQINWDLESGGISPAAYVAIAGGAIYTTGITPNRVVRVRKLVTDQRPFFLLMGQAISDFGGDTHCIIYLCRATSDVKGEFKDGAFMIPGASGIGFPCRVTGNIAGQPVLDAVYDFVQNETITPLFIPIA